MRIKATVYLSSVLFLMLATSLTLAVEMDHSTMDHSGMQHQDAASSDKSDVQSKDKEKSKQQHPMMHPQHNMTKGHAGMGHSNKDGKKHQQHGRGVPKAHSGKHSKGHMMSKDAHHGMQHNVKKSKTTLKRIKVLPKSGKAREMGFDDHGLMETTSVHEDLTVQCAKADRGLVMLDKQSWAKCGSKPQGMPESKTLESKPMDHSQHMGH